jgi:hypothetical protein
MEEFPSPDGRKHFICEPREMRASHWVYSPRLVDSITDSVLLDLEGALWSLDAASWQDDENVAITMRRYPGDDPSGPVTCMVNTCRRTIALEHQTPVSLSLALETLETHYASSCRVD